MIYNIVPLDDEEAGKLGETLLTQKYIINAQHKDDNVIKKEEIYQLISDHESSALNAHADSYFKQIPPNDLAEEIRKSILNLFNAHVSPDGKVNNIYAHQR